MKFEDIANILNGIPYTSMNKGKIFYDFVLQNKFKNCLELGFAHGVSSCYIAAALDELGEGHLTCVDLMQSQDFEPNIETLLRKANLEKYVTVRRENTSYTWYLNKIIEKQTKEYKCEPIYDFCFIDGPKNWTIDGFAFFLADKLLKNEGWIVFDDYAWSYGEYTERTGDNELSSGEDITMMEEREKILPHVKEVFHKLVMQHENYSNFRVEDDILAYAQKIKSSEAKLLFESKANFKYKAISMMKNALGRKF